MKKFRLKLVIFLLFSVLGSRALGQFETASVLGYVHDSWGKGRTFGQDAPFALQELLGGWQVTAINNNYSSQPLNVTYSGNSAQTNSTF